MSLGSCSRPTPTHLMIRGGKALRVGFRVPRAEVLDFFKAQELWVKTRGCRLRLPESSGGADPLWPVSLALKNMT